MATLSFPAVFHIHSLDYNLTRLSKILEENKNSVVTHLAIHSLPFRTEYLCSFSSVPFSCCLDKCCSSANKKIVNLLFFFHRISEKSLVKDLLTLNRTISEAVISEDEEVIVLILKIEQFSIKCHETKTKLNTLATADVNSTMNQSEIKASACNQCQALEMSTSTQQSVLVAFIIG